MPDQRNNPFNFWQELKRRKVIRVIIGYLASAYVILELVSIISDPFGLPEWTLKLVFTLLCIGFIIAVVLSWIFDVTPKGIRKTGSAKGVKVQGKPVLTGKRKIKASDAVIAILLIAVVILAWPRLFGKDKLDDIRDPEGKISVAVMPFNNLSGDPGLDWFRQGISSLIINGLGSSSNLAVRDDHTMFEIMESMNRVITAGITTSQAREVANRAKAETFITGSYQGQGGKYLILANLVDSKSGDVIWSDKVEGDLKSSEYLIVASSLIEKIKDFLEIKALKEEADFDFREAYPSSAEAYRYYIEGMNLIHTRDYLAAVQSLRKAWDIDTTFALASFYIAFAYNYATPAQNFEAKKWINKAYRNKEKLSLKYQYWLELWYACFQSKNIQDVIHYNDLLAGSGIESRLLWFDIGITYYHYTKSIEKAIKAFEKVEEINRERGEPWEYEDFYTWYGTVLHNAGNHEKEREIYELSLELFPTNINKRDIYYRQAICALSGNDTAGGELYIDQYRSILDEMKRAPDDIERATGIIYYNSGMLTEAENKLRKACEMDPRDTDNIFWLADLLIKTGTDLEEGLELVQKRIAISGTGITGAGSLRLKAVYHYKKGEFKEALDAIEKADSLLPALNPDYYELTRNIEQAIVTQPAE
jgi:TolB-like protein